MNRSELRKRTAVGRKSTATSSLVKSYAGRVHGGIFHADALQLLSTLPSDSASIVFLDPPFNLGKQYDGRRPKLDFRPEHQYAAWISSILQESVRILKAGGALYLYHLPSWALTFGAELQSELTFRHWIAVAMKNSFARGKRLYPAHYALLMFSKGEPAHFDRPKVKPLRCRHCGKLIKDYGGYREIIEQKGINLSDIWEDLSPVRHAKRKYRVANELPRAIFDRVVAISGSPGELYVDPFSGAGSGSIAAAERGMHFIAGDLIRSNCTILKARVDAMIRSLK